MLLIGALLGGREDSPSHGSRASLPADGCAAPVVQRDRTVGEMAMAGLEGDCRTGLDSFSLFFVCGSGFEGLGGVTRFFVVCAANRCIVFPPQRPRGNQPSFRGLGLLPQTKEGVDEGSDKQAR